MKKSQSQEDSIMITQEALEVAEVSELLKDKLAKESKKITRIPFYKLEELKKIEEKKQKNLHKIKKKEEHVNNHAPKMQTKIKKSKKQREEDHLNKLQQQQLKAANNNNDNNQLDSSIEKSKDESTDEFHFLNNNTTDINQPSHTNNNSRKVPSKKSMRLSKKQQMLQNREYSLSQFMSAEDKMTLAAMCKKSSVKSHSNKNLLYPENDTHYKEKSRFNQADDDRKDQIPLKANTNSFTEAKIQAQMHTDENNKRPGENVIIIEENAEDYLTKSNSTNVLLKKRKRLTKYKKAIYKYRIKKKQFLYQTVFGKDDIPDKEKQEESQPIMNMEVDKDDNRQPKDEHSQLNLTTSIIPKNSSLSLPNNTILRSETSNITQSQGDNNNNPSMAMNRHDYLNNINSMNNSNTIGNNSSSIYHNTPMVNYYSNYNPNYSYHDLSQYYSQKSQSQYSNYNYSYHPFMPISYYNQMCNNSSNTSHEPNNYSSNKTSTNNNLPLNHHYQNEQIIQTDPHNKFTFEHVMNANNFYLNPPIQQQYHNNKDHHHQHQSGQKNDSDFIHKLEASSNKNQFTFETINKKDHHNNNQHKSVSLDKFKEYLKETYNMDIDINQINGKELNEFLEKHKDITKINLNQIQKYLPKDTMEQYLNQYEGLQKSSNKIIREYVDQVLDKKLDEKFSIFIEKLRDLYYKKKTLTPLKAKKRFVVGMREIEKFIRLKELLCLFVVPNIEKVTGKNSLDDRLKNIFSLCRNNSIPVIFGLNKFKLGKIARKKVSCISMIGIVNVEGFEKELKDLIDFSAKYKEEWYLKNYDKKNEYETNHFIGLNLFDYYQQKKQA